MNIIWVLIGLLLISASVFYLGYRGSFTKNRSTLREVESVYRKKMSPDEKQISVQWGEKISDAIKGGLYSGLLIGLALAFPTMIGMGIKGCIDKEVHAQLVSEQKAEEEKNGKCQDVVYQLGSQPDGKIICHKDAELIVNHAVVECRCRKPLNN